MRSIHTRILAIMSLAIVIVAFQSIALAQAASPHVVVNTFRLNVRSGPGIGHDIITTVGGGTEMSVTMLSADRKWYEVVSPVGTGWVHEAYAVARGDFSAILAARATQTVTSRADGLTPDTARLVVNTFRLNVRTGPGAGHDILTTVPGGTELRVVAIDRGRVWYQVETSAGTGWVNSNFTVGRGDFSSVPFPSTVGSVVSEQPAVAEGAPHLVVNTAYLNVRSGPGIGHGIITTVRGGTVLGVLSIAVDGKWYEVETTQGPGWVHSAYTVGRGDFSGVRRHVAVELGSTPRVVVNTSRLNIRSGSGAGHSIVTSVAGGTTLSVLGVSADGKWFLVEGDFGQGWLRNSYAVFRGDYSLVEVVA